MTALHPVRRTKTARELAEKFNMPERAVKRFMAEPRPVYDARVRKRRLDAASMRDQGMSYAEIAAALEVSEGNARVLVHRGRQARSAA